MAGKLRNRETVGLPQAFSALRHRNFRLFWSGQCVSLIGTWMQNVAQAWLVLQLTDSAFLLGLVAATQFVPMLVLSLFAGVIADRFPKRRLVLATQTTMMLMAAILGTLTYLGVVRYWHVLLLALGLGLANTLDMPARQSFIIELVGREDLMNAIALNSSIFNAARVIGPAVGGLVMGWLGVAPCFFINAASFAAVIIGLLFIRVAEKKPAPRRREPVWADIAVGINYARQTPAILEPLLLMAALSTFAMNFNVLVPTYAKHTLSLTESGYGFLMAALGIGAFAGAVMLAFISHRGPQRALLVAGVGGITFFQSLLALTRWFPLAFLLLMLTGWSMITFTASVNTTIQLASLDELRGRIMSLYSLVFGGVIPFGSLFAGTIAGWIGAPAALAAGAAVGLVLAVCVAALVRRRAPKSLK
ncbi:MAG TPA: MFS transporter [Firmicutes bacterium]|nr:MFS transporter [Bacillota bacterium]